jgi:hypothetical protein
MFSWREQKLVSAKFSFFNQLGLQPETWLETSFVDASD